MAVAMADLSAVLPPRDRAELAGHLPLRVLSLGGGTQSCALALMSAAGFLPRLDHVVFADTQGELPETYAYLAYLRPIVEGAGIGFHVITAGSLEDALLLDHPIDKNPTPPAHVRNPDGTKGRIGAYRCSYDYKRRIITAFVKKLCGGRGAWKRSTVEQWIGFSLEEVGRMRPVDECRCGHKRRRHGPGCERCPKCEGYDPWQVNRWPLIELRMRRDDTIRWFAANGHPAPPRSACWFCPNQGDARWQALRSDHPDLFDRACVLDETIRGGGGGFNNRGKQPFVGELYLHRSLIPLREADLRTRAQKVADAGQGGLFDEAALALGCTECFT